MPVTRRRFLTGSTLAAAALPLADLVRPESRRRGTGRRRARRRLPPRGCQRRPASRPRDPVDARQRRHRRGAGPLDAEPQPDVHQVVARGETPTGAARDFTVKIDVSGLAPATTYYYRFEALGARSAGRPHAHAAGGRRGPRAPGAGVVRQLPARLLQRLRPHRRRAPTSTPCCIWATTSTSTSRAATSTRRCRRSRRRPPARDHRARRLPPPLRALSHRPRPAGGAPPASVHRRVGRPRDRQQHLEHRAPRTTSRPTATSPPAATPPIRRSWNGCRCATPARRASRSSTARSPFGDLADLVMLDTRLAGRDVQVERTNVLGIEDPRRTILGAAQEHWLDGELRESVRAGTALADPRPAGDVRAADAVQHDRRQPRFVGRLSGVARRTSTTWSSGTRCRTWSCSPATCTARGPTICRGSSATATTRPPAAARSASRSSVRRCRRRRRSRGPRARRGWPRPRRRGRTSSSSTAARAATWCSTSPAIGCRPTGGSCRR